ncbi:conserved hypothetical protein [Culex quinquefasciatus]|uniref:Uncharacterized protein n=1 Tax=Culex quinquefasciatus TaxID=7176 RepID=B0XLN1_CULQU|nr:conserved hypothetical protein [Culex quinquefasciatus]|eukprot:XP_001870553.1 conserved hypothetical protein [Culex quinquefasciatus]
MSNYRKNSLVIDFNVLPVSPDMDKIRRFLTKDLELDFSAVRTLQWNISKNQVIIEATTPELAWSVAKSHNVKHFMIHQNQKYRIPIFVENGATEVKVHDLPPQMPNHLIAAHLQQYGDVLSIRDEVWRDFFPGTPNGVRVVRMRINKPIPSFETIEKETAYILYSHQTKTCRHCSRKLHTGQKCYETKIQKNTVTDNNERDTEQQKKLTVKPRGSATMEESENKKPTPIDTINDHKIPQQTPNDPRRQTTEDDTPDLDFSHPEKKKIKKFSVKLLKPGPKMCKS